MKTKRKTAASLAATSRSKTLARGWARWEMGQPSTGLTGATLEGWLDAAQHYEQHRQARIAAFDKRQR